MIERVLTEEARCAVLRALYELVVNEETPASARVAAARLFLMQYEAKENEEYNAIVIVDDETTSQNAV
jgi:hypothetical protein